MGDKTNELIEDLLKEHLREEIVEALNILVNMSEDEMRSLAKISKEIEESSSTI